ncbi:hypothetical protein OG728_39100 (plasmid) [Streptomyces microflavus]|uniref:hypothetical protein n=1 Tax=Streptomyces microflavus TaxID=1919 RepID=UPI002E0DFA61|nr:hypothetical protein OG728_39100 [Streptomyces microflavus]
MSSGKTPGSKRSKPAKPTLKMPDLDFGGFGEGDDEEPQGSGLPADVFGVGPALPSRAAEGPVESHPSLVPQQPTDALQSLAEGPTEEHIAALSAPDASSDVHGRDVEADRPHVPTEETRYRDEPPKASTADPVGVPSQSLAPEPSLSPGATGGDPPVEMPSSSAAVARRQPSRSVANWGTPNSLPAGRPRRSSSKAFTADQRQENRERSMRELFEKAPRYASLLSTYTVVKKTDPRSRNIQLYGLTFERAATQIAIDTAVISRITPRMPTPRLITAHYVDTALQGSLSELNPEETDAERIEDEKDVVFKLAERAIAYRDYITDDEYASQLKHTRTICPLTLLGDALLTRLMALLRTMPALKVQPFEIVSVAVSDLLDGMAKEQDAFEGFLARSVQTTTQ